MEKTTNYEMFKFIEKNRDIKRAQINKLKDSIQKHNLLHMRPIQVNEHMEVIDGQYRLTAARELGVPIYYIVDKTLVDEDIIYMQVQTSWSVKDYFKHYCKKHVPGYLKLQDFMKKNNVGLTVALRLVGGNNRVAGQDFKDGKFVFNDETASENFDIIHRTIGTLQKLHGVKSWMESGKFWGSLMLIIRHENFNEVKWFKNLEMFSEKVVQKASTLDYFNVFKEIFNFRNTSRIEELGEY